MRSGSAATVAFPQSGDNGLEGWLVAQNAPRSLAETVLVLAGAGAVLSRTIADGPVLGITGAAESTNVQGEVQKELDLISDRLFTHALKICPHVLAVVSEEVADIVHVGAGKTGPRLVVAIDPLDGSSNIEVNGGIGTVFSILDPRVTSGRLAEADVLGARDRQAGAGYILYGPATVMVLCVGGDAALFSLDRSGTFILVRDRLTLSSDASEFSINMAHRDRWDSALRGFIEDRLLGEKGALKKAYNMRWAGAMVADMHRVLTRGGIFIYPALSGKDGAEGKLRFLYEANPMAMLVAAAGGRAASGGQPLSDFVPKRLHTRVPVALGSANEIEDLIARYR